MITLLTCFMEFSRTPYFTSQEGKKDRWNIDMFRPFVDAGLRCIIVIDSDYNQPEWMNCDHVQIVRVKYDINSNVSVPASGNPEKDTPEYISWTYRKPRAYLEAIKADTANSTHYMCLDYDAATWLSADAIGYLKWIFTHSPDFKGICIPGGREKYTDETVKTVASQLYWRYCNGCIFADKLTLKEWCDVHHALISGFKQIYCNNVLPWDVNYVAWLEYKELCPTINWYSASHNRSMIENIPAECFISPIPKKQIREKTIYNYPTYPKHYPSSASVCKIGETWWLMTRYVNYWMYPTGYYHFYDADQKIRTRNLLSRLSDETWEPVESWFVDDDVLGCDGLPLPTLETKLSFGVEDVRIYEGADGEMRFVGATLGFSPKGNARIVSGVVNIQTTDNKPQFVQATVHSSDEWCEKNWIPDPRHANDTNATFIYKWSREGIVLKSTTENSDNRVISVSPEHSGIIHRFRGSSILMPYQDGYKCVVHWSKEGSPRTYYHCTVSFTEDLAIREISPGFMFEGAGIEFCIGYIPGDDNDDRFWVSRFDRDPFMIVLHSK